MPRNRSWSALLSLALTLNWINLANCRMVEPLGLKPHRPRTYYESMSPDAEIDQFMKSQGLRYHQPLNGFYDKGGLVDYDLRESGPSMVDVMDYPAQYDRGFESKVQGHLVEPQPEAIPSKPLVEQHIKETPHEAVQPKDKVKVETRSSVGQVGANQVAAVVPGLSEAVRHEEPVRLSEGSSIADVYLLAVIAGCAGAAVSGLALTGLCWYRLHKRVKATSDVEYPAYGVTGPASDKVGPPGDRKLAQSAQMYHYQHQKQQMIASERLEGGNGSEGESEEECEEGDYTVFECPGLATGGEMEVRNPLFNDQTPVATPAEK